MRFPMKEAKRYNSTTPPAELDSRCTPTDRTFLVYHLGIPDIDAGRWRLSIGGLVRRPATLALRDLLALPQATLHAVHECAGSPLRPTVPVRRVANVSWTGVRLRPLLLAAEPLPEARYAWFGGADSGVYPPTGVYNEAYVKDVPLEAALGEDVLLATAMNGQPLAAERGAPLRLVVPGFYGTNSVKWLTDIRLESGRSQGYFTADLYNDEVVEGGVPRRVPVWQLAPSSLIVAPQSAGLRAGRETEIRGWAWGEREIRSVRVSTDGESTWREAALEPRRERCWQRFHLPWTPAAPGRYELASCATDDGGRSQPKRGARNEVFRSTVEAKEGEDP